jgi:hypothetical protein
MAVKGLEFAKAWERRVQASFESITMNVVCKEDLLISKEAAGRPQDLIDADALRKSDDIAKQEAGD